ncbi:nucleolus protein [Crepidotus variabilis]|uniref:25S rRNA adenine-N(1) methyltransferase n=1 Tax=Crepidotus variabilis TaxID=179855 RepID=A0A9P6ENZ2_9AGAR|nr:nucleolus protein [Crepidotus variabilis]
MKVPKAKKRKAPIVQSTHGPSTDAHSCRHLIRQFHVLLKRQKQLQSNVKNSSECAMELEQIGVQISRLGGLEKYQQMSALGQKEERGGGSEKILIGWMKDLTLHHRPNGQKLQLLEVGALKHDNYRSCQSWIECTPIDLRSRHPQILEKDFLTMDKVENADKWEVISLSLVINFVSSAEDRGRMLVMARDFLRADGLLFLALPLPCVANSRYMTFAHLKSLMASIGFTEIHEKWKPDGKMAYWLYQKTSPHSSAQIFSKKTVLRQGNRNNFVILVKR